MLSDGTIDFAEPLASTPPRDRREGSTPLHSTVLDLEAEGAHGSLELAELDGARLVGVKQV